MAFDDKRERVGEGPDTGVPSQNRKNIKKAVTGSRDPSSVGRGSVMALFRGETYADKQKRLAAKKDLSGSNIQRSQGDNAAQLNTGTQDASGVGALSNTPEAPSRTSGAQSTSLETLLDDRQSSPGQQGSRLGGYTSSGNRLSTQGTGGGTFSTIGPQRDTTGRDSAIAQLEAMERIREIGNRGGTPSNYDNTPTMSSYERELEDRKKRMRQSEILGNIDSAVRRRAMSARAGEAAKAKYLGLQQEAEISQAKLAQDASQFRTSSAQAERGLDIKERTLATNRQAAQVQLAQANEGEARRRAEVDRKFSLDVAKYGLDEAKMRESERSNRLGEQLDLVKENRQQFETQLEQQRATTGKVAEIGKFLKGRKEGGYTDAEAIMGISRLGDNPLDFFSPEEYEVGSQERQLLLQLEADMLERKKRQLGQ